MQSLLVPAESTSGLRGDDRDGRVMAADTECGAARARAVPRSVERLGIKSVFLMAGWALVKPE